MQMEMASADETVLASARQDEGDKRLHVRFFLGATQDAEATKREGRPIYKDVPFVEIWTPGDKTNVIKGEAWIDTHHQRAHNNRFPAQWAAFQRGQDQEAVSGTPIDKLPGITEGQVQELRHFRVRTIEQLAGLTDGACANFMGVLALRQRANDWLETARGNAPMEQMRAELAQRDAQMEEMRAQLAELTAARAAEPAKRGPGRPPKNTEA